jgi:hypothetical protein
MCDAHQGRNCLSKSFLREEQRKITYPTISVILFITCSVPHWRGINWEPGLLTQVPHLIPDMMPDSTSLYKDDNTIFPTPALSGFG